MLNILFYTSFSTRSRDTESLMQAFVRQGHSVFLLSQSERGPYHTFCETLGVRAYAHSIPKNNSVGYFLKHSFFLKKFIRENTIQVVYAHLENAGLAAVLCRPFVKAKIFTCRHIVDEAVLMNSRKFEWLNRIVYKLSSQVIVVSQRSKGWMVEEEGISEQKIRVIPLAYNFELYPAPSVSIVKEIRSQFSGRFLMLTACRMMRGKRPEIALNICKQLVEKGIDVNLLLLGDGPLLEEIKTRIKTLALEDRVFALGYRPNMMDYLAACDLLLHPSIQDSSSVIIKEAGLNSKAVICCKDTGDTDEYLIDGKNALLVDRQNTESEMTEKIQRLIQNPSLQETLGKELRSSVLKRFSIETILPQYTELHSTIEKEWNR